MRHCYIPDGDALWFLPTCVIQHIYHRVVVVRRIARGFDIATAFIRAQMYAAAQFKRLVGQQADAQDDSIVTTILQESRAQVGQARQFLRDVEFSFPKWHTRSRPKLRFTVCCARQNGMYTSSLTRPRLTSATGVHRREPASRHEKGLAAYRRGQGAKGSGHFPGLGHL